MIRERFYKTGEIAMRFLSSEVRGLQAAAYVLAASALLSSLLALARDRLLAYHFGASTTLDIYYAGFRIPDLIFVCTGALVSVYMLIPELSRRDARAQHDYIDTIFFGFSLFAGAVCAIAFLFAPLILPHFFPSFGASEMRELVHVTRILLLQPIFLGISNILAAVTQARHRYLLYAVSPLLYNLGIIAGIEWLYPVWGITGLAWGVVAGALLHAGIQLPSLVSEGFLRRLPALYERGALLRTAALSVPRALALSMSQITLFGLVALAGALPAGSIAVFMFAYNLQAVPLAVIGASYSVAAFPTLAAALSNGRREEFIHHVVIAARYVIFWSIPASVLILVLRAYLVRVILGSGAFDWTDTRLTAAAFALLALSLAAQGIQLLLVRGYYAAGRTFAPFVIALLSTLGTLALASTSLHILGYSSALSFMESFMRVEGTEGAAVLGLAFAYASVSIVSTIVLALHFEFRFGGLLSGVGRVLLESVVAALCGGVAAYATLAGAGLFFPSTDTLSIFTVGLLGGTAGIVVTSFMYYILGNREFRETYATLRVRLWRRASAEGAVLVTSAES